jgi:hypothetical protein
MIRRYVLFVAALGLAAGSYAQAPGDVIDPHENPAVQNSPDGKKIAPGAATPAKATIPTAPPSKKPTKSAAKAKEVQIKPPNPEEVVLGTWKLIPEKSSFNPGPAPQSEVRTYIRTSAGITATTITTKPDGSVRTVTFPWQPDGKEHPVTGSDLLDTIRLEQVDNLTAEASLRHGDKVLASERRAVTADGKTMTIVVKDMTSDDRPITATAVYEKQP